MAAASERLVLVTRVRWLAAYVGVVIDFSSRISKMASKGRRQPVGAALMTVLCVSQARILPGRTPRMWAREVLALGFMAL
jgi:hypothetical protein